MSPPADAPLPLSDEAAAESGVVARRAGVVAALTFASRVMGYVRDAVLANRFGASAAFDAFVVALTIPNLLRRLVAEGALQTAFVPLLSAEKERGGTPAMRAFSAAVLGLLLPVLAGFVAVGVFFPGQVVEVFAPGFDPERVEIARALTAIMMPYIFFVSLQALAGGALNVEGHFAAPAAAPVLLNVAIVAMALGLGFAFSEPIYAAAWGVTLGGVVQLLLQLPFLARHGLLVGPRWDLRDPALRTLLKRMAPQIFGVAVYQLNLLVVRQIGSYLPKGQLSCYYNATRLQEFALGVFAVSVSVAALPTLSIHAARQDWRALTATFARALKVTNFITIPSALTLVFTAGPIVDVLFRHGAFGLEAAETTASLLVILGLAIVPIGVARVVVPTFYALGDTATPVWGAAASLAATYALGYALGDRFAIQGLTAATTGAAIVQVIVLGAALSRAIRRRTVGAPAAASGLVGHALRATLAAFPAAGLAGLALARFSFPEHGKFAGAVILFSVLGAAAGLYFALAKLFRLPETDLVLGAIRRRVFRRGRRP